MSKQYGDGGFYFLQPVNSPRQVVSTYGDGGFFFVQPINSPQQVVSTYGALIHPKSGLQYGAPRVPQRRVGGSRNAGALGQKMTIIDADGVVKTYPCPMPGVVYDPATNPCGEKPWWSSTTAWNTYRLTGKWPVIESKEDPKCAEMVQAYLAARSMPGISESALNALYENLTKMGCSVPRPEDGAGRTPGQDLQDTKDVDKEEAGLETEEEESFLSRYGLALGIGAGVLLLSGTAALLLRRRKSK
jgi:hypothetical protein